MQTLIEKLGHLDGRELLEPLIQHFGGQIALVSSFGAESAVLLHMLATIDRGVPVIFIDTDKHFVETKLYRRRLVRALELSDVRIVRPLAADLARDDPQGMLHRFDADRCCHIRKTLPLQAALHGFSAWITGRKRFHGGARARLPTMELVDGRLKIDPLAHFSQQQIRDYMRLHDLPDHPLAAAGYMSIGCMPCTAKAGSGGNPRAGRWAGQDKTECGIHWSVNGKPIRLDAPSGPPPAAAGC